MNLFFPAKLVSQKTFIFYKDNVLLGERCFDKNDLVYYLQSKNPFSEVGAIIYVDGEFCGVNLKSLEKP
jgi:hypothetical protein